MNKPWCASLFLAGSPVAQRAFVIPTVPVADSVSLIYDPSDSLPAMEWDFVGFADGALGSQPLALKTEAKVGGATVLVGDFDSLSPKLRAEFSQNRRGAAGVEVLKLSMEKDLSDGAALLDRARAEMVATCRKGSREIPVGIWEILGAWGGRMDHQWANLEELKSLFSHALPLCLIVPPFGLMTNVPMRLSGLPQGMPLSVFGLTGHSTGVDLQGLSYSGEFVLARPSHGLSNEVTASTVHIAPRCFPAQGIVSPVCVVLEFLRPA